MPQATLHKQLSSYFEEYCIFFPNQYGFRPKHSTEYAALELIDRIINKMDTNKIPIDMFLDLSKAFDTIHHTILLHKLNYYGLEDSTLRLFESYLKTGNNLRKLKIANLKCYLYKLECHKVLFLDLYYLSYLRFIRSHYKIRLYYIC